MSKLMEAKMSKSDIAAVKEAAKLLFYTDVTFTPQADVPKINAQWRESIPRIMRDVDKGRAWLVFVGALGTQFLNGALNYGSAVIHVALLDYFHESVTETAVVGSIFINLLALLGPIGSIAINLTSCRTAVLIGGSLVTIGMTTSFFAHNLKIILVTYAIIAGSGLGITTTTSVVVLGYAFKKYIGITVGMTVAAQGAGMFVCGPLIQYLLEEYGFHGTFLLLGGISSHFYVFGSLMKPTGLEKLHKKQMNNTAKHSSKCNIFRTFLHYEVFKNKSFLLVLCSSLSVGLPYTLVLLHLPYYSVYKGSSHSDSAFLIALVGLGSMLNRILTGLTIGKGDIDVLLLYFGAVTIAGIATIAFPSFSFFYVGRCVYSFVLGLYSGSFIALINPLCLELVGLQQLSTAVGLYYCFLGIGGIVGPPVAGFIVDSGGTYETSFYVAGCCFLLSSVFTLLSTVTRTKKQTRGVSVDDVEFTVINQKPIVVDHVTECSDDPDTRNYIRESGLMVASEYLLPDTVD